MCRLMWTFTVPRFDVASLLLVVLALWTASAQGWEFSHFLPVDRSFVAVAGRSGEFVVIDDELAISTDGTRILAVERLPAGLRLAGIAANHRYFVAVGWLEDDESTGVVLGSVDGKRWREVYRGPGAVRGVAFGDGRWIVVGDGGVVVGSADLWEWTQAALAEVERGSLADVVWTGEQWVAVGRRGGADGEVCGWIATSPDGYAWATVDHTCGRELTGLASSPSGMVAVGDSILHSSDGVSWTENPGSNGATVVWDGQHFLAFRTRPVLWDTSTVTEMAVSSDGLSWSWSDLPFISDVTDAAYDGQTYMFVGQATVRSSQDLSDWRVPASPTPVTNPTSLWPVTITTRLLTTEHGLLAGGQIAGVNEIYGGWGGMEYVGVSTDGTKWDWRRIPGSDWPVEVAARGRTVVAKGGYSWESEWGRMYVTDDLRNWDYTDIPNMNLGSVAAGDPGFVVAANPYENWFVDPPSLYFSADGREWTAIRLDESWEIWLVRWVNGRFVAAASNGVAVSGDGTSWTFQRIPDFGQTYALAGNGTTMVRAADSGVEYSNDGLTWEPAEHPPAFSVADVVWNGRQFLAVGENGWFSFSDAGNQWRDVHSGWWIDLWHVAWFQGRPVVRSELGILAAGHSPRRAQGQRGVSPQRPGSKWVQASDRTTW